MYYMEYLTGNFILGYEGIHDIELTLEWFKANIDDIFIPLYVGTAFYSIIVTGVIYLILNRLWVNSVHSEKNEKRKDRKKREKKKHIHHKGKN